MNINLTILKSYMDLKLKLFLTQLAGAAEYTNCFYAEE